MPILSSFIQLAADVSKPLPADFDLLPLHGTDNLSRNAAVEWPDQPALAYRSSAEESATAQTLSFSQQLRQIRQTANLLHRLDVGPVSLPTSRVGTTPILDWLPISFCRSL